MRPYVLAETSWKTVAETGYDVAVLPWGATEAHNRHLPYGTDTIQAEHVAIEAAKRAWDGGARVTVLPAVPFGVQAGQLDIPFCINMNPSTQAKLLEDVACSLEGQGIRKLVVLNGHGGNDFRPMIRELQGRLESFLCVLNWYQAADARRFFTEPGDHAGELETSVMRHVAPSLVLPLHEAGPGEAKSFRIAALRDGWVWAPRAWREVTADTGVGDPRAATPEAGSAFLDAVVTRIAEFLMELAAANLEDMYE